ncbi:hypothetical protein [Streptomyces albidoflavus]|uniref:hypothetical protein n=1 Tax=Streptomyces albidoflavus TaxID=1886 RepID=UPI0033C70A40
MQVLVRTGGAGSRPHLQSPSPPGRLTVSEEGTQVPRPRTTAGRPRHRRPLAGAPNRIEAAA